MNLTVNRLPAPTWNRLHMNQSVIEDLTFSELKGILEGDNGSPAADFSAVGTGMGPDMDRLAGESKAAPVRIQAGEESRAVRKLHFACQDGREGFQDVELLAKEGSTLTVYMDAVSDKKAAGFFGIRTRMKLEKNARIRLVQTQLLGEGFRYFNDIGAACADGAAVELVQIFLGGAATWTGCQADLAGKGSSLSADIGYYQRGAQRLDMNYVALHRGKKTSSRIIANGILKDEAFKLFRGTIDFQNGCAASEGEEQEDVLLLGDDVVNQTIPLILCAEEDVQGNHGATIGRPDEETLFYLGARGLSQEEAINMLARARIDAVAKQMGDEEAEKQVQDYLTEEMGA